MPKSYLLSFLLLSSMHTSKMSQLQNNSLFGNFNFAKNYNFAFSGQSNTGTIENNSNLNLNATNCQFNLNGNTNGKITAVNSNIECINCPNINIDGQENKIVSEKNSNAKLRGNNNQWEARSNSNLKVVSNFSILKLFQNKNGNFDLEHASLVAEKNTNLKVSGKDCKVEVKNTVNHELKRVGTKDAASSGLENRLELSPGTGSSMSCSIGFSGNGNNIQECQSSKASVNPKFTLDFIDQAIIDGTNYKIGAFGFSLKPDNGDSYQFVLDNATVEKRVVSDKEVVLTLAADGNKHSLRIRAGSVTAGSVENTFTLCPVGLSNL